MSPDRPPDPRDLDAQLALLPKELPPQRDLWPQILAAIDGPRSARSPLRALPSTPRAATALRYRPGAVALAAGIALAVTAGLFGWQLDRVRPGSLAGEVGTSGFAVPEGAGYLRTRAELQRTYRERLELLAPPTRARIEQDLATIRAANQDIRRALAAEPQSEVLNRLLESTWQQEFDLYATVVRNTEPAMQRSPI